MKKIKKKMIKMNIKSIISSKKDSYCENLIKSSNNISSTVPLVMNLSKLFESIEKPTKNH